MADLKIPFPDEDTAVVPRSQSCGAKAFNRAKDSQRSQSKAKSKPAGAWRSGVLLYSLLNVAGNA
jgi:hypothetical protein